MRLASGSFSGDGADNRQITGVGFQPDVVFIKCDCDQRVVVRTSTMSGDASKAIGLTGPLLADLVQSLDADGFTVGADNRVNNSGQMIYWTAMKAGTALKLGSYVGDGLDNRSITGVGFQPVWVVTLGDGDDSWFRPGTITGDASFAVDGNNTFTNRIQGLESDGFQLGSNDAVNEAGTTFHYIAWEASSAVVQTSYSGNGVDNTSITGVGFQPQFVWIHRRTANPGVWRSSSMSGDLTQLWTASAGVANRIQALESDGFQVGLHTHVNNSSSAYEYLALRDSP